MKSPFATQAYHFSLSRFLVHSNWSQKYSTCHTIHNSKETATKYLSSGLKLVKLSYLAGSFDQSNMFLHDLLVANILNTAATELFTHFYVLNRTLYKDPFTSVPQFHSKLVAPPFWKFPPSFGFSHQKFKNLVCSYI